MSAFTESPASIFVQSISLGITKTTRSKTKSIKVLRSIEIELIRNTELGELFSSSYFLFVQLFPKNSKEFRFHFENQRKICYNINTACGSSA